MPGQPPSSPFIEFVFEPATGCIIVMGSRENDAISPVVMRGMGVGGKVLGESELEHPHPRKAKLRHDLSHIRGDHAKVFGNDGKKGQAFPQHRKEVRAGSAPIFP